MASNPLNPPPPPAGIPIPIDDGACDHLVGTTIPTNVTLPATNGSKVDLRSLSGLTILFCYPRTGAPGEEIPKEWDDIPGARGCSPQACAFGDLYASLLKLGVHNLYGLSTQPTEYQREAKERLHLPYEMLSDENFELINSLQLPTFDFRGTTLVKRATLAIVDGRVHKVWYPVFPTNENAANVEKWLKTKQQYV
ncbi:hypothetical protein YB2330_006061 [Saitoella coloradoensis]